MKIAVIDADLIGRKKHRFPNLTCLKLSGYYKEEGNDVVLKMDYDRLEDYDKVFIAKVFTDTEVPNDVLSLPNVTYGGTGFFYDKAIPLPYNIEHHFPDYHLYDEWVEKQIASGKKPKEFVYYKDYSIGFLTRGCFRHCPFCVNKNYNRVQAHSPLSEFLDTSRKKIAFLDDNFFGYRDWETLLDEVRASGKRFQFRQGLDERLLDDKRCEKLFSSKYDGDFIFAFDNIKDARLIEEKLALIRKYTNKQMKFYVICGFDYSGQWGESFWRQDLFDLMERIRILMKWRCYPYIMRFARYKESPYSGFYITVARWCNQPNFYKKVSLLEFARMNGENSAAYKAVAKVLKDEPGIEKYLSMAYERMSAK